jgi:hypothetical protein
MHGRTIYVDIVACAPCISDEGRSGCRSRREKWGGDCICFGWSYLSINATKRRVGYSRPSVSHWYTPTTSRWWYVAVRIPASFVPPRRRLDVTFCSILASATGVSTTGRTAVRQQYPRVTGAAFDEGFAATVALRRVSSDMSADSSAAVGTMVAALIAPSFGLSGGSGTWDAAKAAAE